MKRFFITLAAALLAIPAMQAGNINGRVLADGKPLEGVLVSDGVKIVRTNALGRYSMDSDKVEGSVFVITPSGYYAQTLDGLRPGFWQDLHLPVDQAETHDFNLVSENQDVYTVLFPADMHLSNDPRRNDLNRFKEIALPVIRELAAKAEGPVYSFNMGDTTHEIYWGQFNFNEADGLRFLQDVGYPTRMYAIMGNHDHDASIVGEDVDHRSAWLENDCWGPGRYSVNIGGDHWIFLDDMVYINEAGKGKKAPGVNGDRSYKTKFTKEQMAWLELELSYVPSNAHVYICTHAPIFGSRRADGVAIPTDQMDKIADMCKRFTKGVDMFSGHIHMFDICDCQKYPNFHQYSLPAVSGTLWETRQDWPLINSDGGDAGIFSGRFSKGDREYKYTTFAYGEKYYRVYDMNTVGNIYRNNEGVKKQQELFASTRKDYSDKQWKNWVFVNYYGWRPGDKVEMFENGKPLKVIREEYEDPVKNLAYEIPILMNPVNYHHPSKSDYCRHMFEAKARSATSTVTLRITAEDGTVRFQEDIARPQAWPFTE